MKSTQSVPANAIPLLVVEDSNEDYAALERVFRLSELPIAAFRCSNGSDALDALYQRGSYAETPRPRLIMLDLNLPGIDGRKVLAEIKADPDLRTIPVLVLTTSNNPRDIDDCYKSGANSYLIKPVDYPHFKQTIQKAMSYWVHTVVLPD